MPNRALSQGSRKIWTEDIPAIENELLKYSVYERYKKLREYYEGNKPHPNSEILVYQSYQKLKEHFHSVIKSSTKSPAPLMAFERWQFSSKLAQEKRLLASTSRVCDSALFITDPEYVDDGLIQNLKRVGIQDSDAHQISAKLSMFSIQMAEKISEFLKYNKTSDSPNVIAVKKNKHNIDLLHKDSSKLQFKVNYEHLKKLRMLWELARRSILKERDMLEGLSEDEKIAITRFSAPPRADDAGSIQMFCFVLCRINEIRELARENL